MGGADAGRCRRWCAVTDRPNEKSWIASVSLRNNANTLQFPDTGQSIQKLFTATQV